jgi:hypothetical protein
MKRRPRDPNQLAKSIIGIATGETAEPTIDPKSAAARGRAGGLKGGKARAANMTASERKAAAKKAIAARWARKHSTS